LCFGSAVIIAGETSKTQGINDYTCKDFMILSGKDRDIALAFAHGYRLGEKKTTQYSTQLPAEATDKFIDYCLENPGQNALESRRKFAP
jgi:hypothetical protein